MIFIAPFIRSASAEEAVRVFSLTFDGDLEQLAPIYTEGARRQSRKTVLARSAVDRVMGFFKRGEGRLPSFGGVRLALLARGRWLYVDESGNARLTLPGGSFDVRWFGKETKGALGGRFDVAGFEAWRRGVDPDRDRWASTSLVSVSAANLTSGTLSVVNAAGAVEARVPPKGSRSFTTWRVPHKVYVEGRLVANIDYDLKARSADELGTTIEWGAIPYSLKLGPSRFRTKRDWFATLLARPSERSQSPGPRARAARGNTVSNGERADARSIVRFIYLIET